MVKTFGAPRECGAPGQLPLLPPPPPPPISVALYRTGQPQEVMNLITIIELQLQNISLEIYKSFTPNI